MNIKNLSLSLVATAPTPATTGTSLVLESGTGSRFPNTDDESFYVTAMPPGENPHIENSEILKVIDITGDTITMVREQRGSTAKSIGVGWIIVNGVYAEDVSGILEALDALNIEGDPDNKVTTTLNENDFASDSATALATQKSIRSYVDNVAETLSSADGWISANENWTYSSATEITVPSGATSKYQKGDKIKLTQGTVKYFYIIKVEDTTLTITAGSDYTLVNSAITENYYSKVENPQGFPGYFYYNVQWKGSTTNPTIGNGVLIGKFKISGSFISITIYLRTGSTTTYGKGYYGLTYPGQWAKPPSEEDYAGATHWLTGFGHINGKCYFLGQAGAERLRCSGTKEGTCTPTYPETWKSGDILSLTSTTEFRG